MQHSKSYGQYAYRLRHRYLRKIALTMAITISWQAFYPTAALALTGGPSQPEVHGFQPVGTSDMVDLFTGDFKYNIPLLDVGGYPLNLSYQGGATNDEEASWVGLGWSLNPGTITRNMRGLPDDFKGDNVQKEFYMKPNITKGVHVGLDFELFGWKPEGNIAANKAQLSVGVGVFHNNYRGLGIELEASPAVNFGDKNIGVGADLSYNSQQGFDMGLSGSLSFGKIPQKVKAGTGFNSRSGMHDLTFSYAVRATQQMNMGNIGSLSFGSRTYTPTNPLPLSNESYTGNVTLGVEFTGLHPDLRFKGYWTKQALTKELEDQPAYGYLYLDKTKKDGKEKPILDYNKERSTPFKKEHPAMSPAIGTYDLFSASGQGAGGQFRLSRNDVGVFTSARHSNSSFGASIGVELGMANIVHNGLNLGGSFSDAESGKWKGGDELTGAMGFRSEAITANNTVVNDYEPAYFKNTGESPVFSGAGTATWEQFQRPEAIQPAFTNGVIALWSLGVTNEFKRRNAPNIPLSNVLQKATRTKRNDVFSYLTGAQADKRRPDRNMIENHVRGANGTQVNIYPRGIHPMHHISEVNITQANGSRYVYGIPAYVNKQVDETFTIKKPATPRADGLAEYDLTKFGRNDSDSRDRFWDKQTTPAYAHSYLLTEVLSPDYVDVKNDGITDDDLGTAVKLNYNRHEEAYPFRTPSTDVINRNGIFYGLAQHQEGNLTDPFDDRGHISYGTKEIWYVHSIETKTMVAEFHTSDRADAYGIYNGEDANGNVKGVDASKKLKKLDKIVLYSKADLSRGGTVRPIPVKTVHFTYDNSLCKNLPNAETDSGKLTLKKVHFTYGNNKGGDLNAYAFTYNNDGTTGFTYDIQNYDRWGNYKPSVANPNGLSNKEYPYAVQNQADADKYARAWNLTEIKLPSGGRIAVTYEADDYAYVQNKRASQMFRIVGFSHNGVDPPLNTAEKSPIYDRDAYKSYNYVHVDLTGTPYGRLSPADFKQRYLEEVQYLHATAFVELTPGNSEYVRTYFEVNPKLAPYISSDGKQAGIPIRVTTEELNPVAESAIQKLRLETPALIYPGYDQQMDETFNRGAFERLVSVGTELTGIFKSFRNHAKGNNWAKMLDTKKSWLRLNAPTYAKWGGGHRVKKVEVKNHWGARREANPNDRSYGQTYNYTTENPLRKGESMSSGVAAYEPGIGSEENPFKIPDNYDVSSKKIGPFDVGPVFHEFLERPYGESLFPAPVVGYSKVTVENIKPSQIVIENNVEKEKPINVARTHTGYVVHEFYTAKDFPTRTEMTNLETRDLSHPPGQLLVSFLTNSSRTILGAAQGFLVEVNDMHGKPYLETTFNGKGDRIAFTKYNYRLEQANTGTLQSPRLSETEAGVKVLKNDYLPIVSKVNGAPVVSNNGIVGYECDVWQEMHEESCYSGSLNVGFNLDVFTATIIPIPTLTAFPNISFDQKLYRGAVTTKLVKRTGILDKVTKMENGSTVSTRNLLWDAETGQVLLTETQNEFKDPIYQFSYPAHWEYDGMGLAYANDGMTVPAVTIAAGTAPEAVDSKLTHGDELLLVSTANGNNAGTRAYVVKVVRAGVPSDKQITDEAGNPVAGTFMLKVLRSGRRNLASTPIGSVTLLANPIQGTTLNLSSRVLNAQATLFRDDWAVRQANFAADCATTTGCLETGFVEMDCRRPMDGWKTFLQNFVAWKAEGRDLHMGSRTVYDFLAGDPRVQESDDFLCMGKPSELKCIEETGTIQSARTCLSYVSISYTRYEMLIINTNTNKQYKFVIEPAEWGEQPNNATGAVFLINERASVVPGLLATAEWRIKANMELNPVPLNEECQGYLRPHLEMEGCVRTGPIATNNSEVVLDPNIRVNPYQLGIKGNWRPYEAFAVNSRRVQGQTPSGTISSTLTAGDRNLNEPRILRGNGVIPINIVGTKYFEPFVWAGSIGTKSPVQNWYTERQQGKWVKTNTITHYDQKGNEIENKDALGIYSSALYRYQNTLASAVTANAQTRETAFDGFEDYMFNRNAVALGQTTLSTCYPAHWDMLRKQDQLLMANLTQDKAHTGNYSLKLPPQNPPFQKTLYMNESLAERLQNTENRAVLDNDNTKLDRVLPYFSLMPNKKYLISAWVSKKGECSPTDLSSLSLKIDGQAFKPAGPIIEGWQRIEGVVSWSTIPAEMNIEFSNPSNDIAYLDDIRILPFSAKMKSFAYDDRTMRLMAQLDENNYATFYEYDDEGSLVRTKKETERGVVTLQENRNYLRPN